MKIGIFGGSFNPPHKMHKAIAEYLIRNKYIDKVIYVPTGNKYNKQGLIDAKYRYEMLEIMTRDSESLEVSNYEIKNALTYTYQTLDYFKSIYTNDEIYFICGSDNLKEITTWKNYNYILDNYSLLVSRRNNDDVSKIINELKIKNIIVVDTPISNISSTILRNKIKEGYSIDNIDENVLKYILDNKLYR